MAETVLIHTTQTRLVGSTLTATGDVSEWFGLLLLEAAEACGQRGSITEARARIYAADLAEYEPAQVVAAFRRARREGRGFFPSVAEIVQQIGPSGDDMAILAWAGLLRAAADVGAYQPLQIDDWCAAEALRRSVGSWDALCALGEGPEQAIARQQFLAAFRQARREQPADAGPQLMLGLSGEPPDGKADAVWGARLTASYAVVPTRASDLARPAISAGRDVRRLTDGRE